MASRGMAAVGNESRSVIKLSSDNRRLGEADCASFRYYALVSNMLSGLPVIDQGNSKADLTHSVCIQGKQLPDHASCVRGLRQTSYEQKS